MAYKDVLGRELAVNDLVVMQQPNYADLLIGKVESFTPKKVRVSFPKHQGKKGDRDTKLCEPVYLYRMHDEDAIKYRLTHPDV
jgi:hypothetical protein